MPVQIEQIQKFIQENIYPKQKAIIGVSGGVDSDVVARLVYQTIGKERTKLYMVKQSDMETAHIENARNLANELDINLIEINLSQMPYQIITEMEKSDIDEGFNRDGLLDTAKTKVALRTIINSIYQERGYKVVGASNKTEITLGFFLPFGDGIAHLKPIAHLYKTEVFELAKKLGTNDQVLKQAPSAGLWEKQEDLEDIAYWIYNEAPIQVEKNYTDTDIENIEEIHKQLSFPKLDLVLQMLENNVNNKFIELKTSFPESLIKKIKNLICASRSTKLQTMNTQISD